MRSTHGPAFRLVGQDKDPAKAWDWVAPDGRHLGTIRAPEVAASCGWRDDGRTLYITAETGVYRIRLDAAGF